MARTGSLDRPIPDRPRGLVLPADARQVTTAWATAVCTWSTSSRTRPSTSGMRGVPACQSSRTGHPGWTAQRTCVVAYCYVPQCGYWWCARLDGCVMVRAEEGAAVPVLLFARPPIDAAEERTIRKLAGARHAPGDWIRRARMIAHSWDGLRTTQIAELLGCHPQTVRERLHRFNAEGVAGLGDRPGPGRPRRLSETERGRIIALARSQPPGRLHPGGERLLAPTQPEGIRVGRSQIRRILLAEGTRWRRTRSWTTSTDPEFAPKEHRSSPSTPPRRRR